MPRINYKGITFDSQLEIDYYNELVSNKLQFIYHPTQIYLNKSNKYTPDFIVVYPDRIEIVETKGYSQFSFMKDNMTHNIMLEKPEEELSLYVQQNGIDTTNKKVIYRKIKMLKSVGFVDWDYKNPNTLANKRKLKIEELTNENKELKNALKDYDRYFSYITKEKLTKAQIEWLNEFKLKKGI